MPNSKNQRRLLEDKNRRKLGEKSSSFHGQIPVTMAGKLQRPKTLPDLLSGRSFVVSAPEEERPRLTKLLLNMTIRGSLGPVQVVMTPEDTVADLIAAALKQYVKEGRRPILPSSDPAAFGLHYSQFSLESLSKEEKLITLGSRNFFLCPKPTTAEDDGEVTTSLTCSKEAEKVAKNGFLKFMNFMF